ncbi:MAG: hypothetical protein D3910_21135, partial [Candidatus Electrothrix sp. ATG2]|nr:hypothetical protein [Candidatus Electrothrix sp. ATG2]
MKKREKQKKIKTKYNEPRLWVQESHRLPQVVEELRVLKNRVIRFNEKKGIKTILLTGVDRQTGVSAVAFNLSLIYSRDLPDRRILLIDTNMRHASLHSSFDIPITPGFMDFLYGNKRLPDVTWKSFLPNLDLIPFGQTYEDCPAPFTLPSFRNFTERIREQYDLILFDSDAGLKSDHTQSISSQTDGVIMIAEAQKTRLEAV